MINKKKGFTLIELLVVIAIIGILSSVVLASLNSARQKSRDAKRISDIKQIQLALELYFDSCGQYPNVLDTTAAVGCSGSTDFGDFLSTIPTDPTASPADYYYYASSGASAGATCTTYHLAATLEDTGHTALGADADLATASGAHASLCTGSDAFVDGSTAGVYDVIP